MRCALKAKGIYDVLEKVPPSAAQPEELTEWIRQDAQAMFLLTSTMDLKQITLIENCESAKEMLQKLDAIYMQKSETNKMLVHERFHQYKMNPNDTIAQHIAKVENLARQIRKSGELISDTAVMTKVLSSLPMKYRNVRQAWLSLDENKQTIANLTARLLDEEASLSSYEEAETALAAVSLKDKTNQIQKSTKSSITCYNCHKKGHIARNCRKPKRKANNQSKEQSNDTVLSTSSETAFNVETENQINSEEKWIMDSGASAHMCYRRDFFSIFEEFKSKVWLGNNQSLEVQGKGTIRIRKLIDNKWQNATINDVLFVPELRKNLFSEGAITNKGMKVVKEGSRAEIFQLDKLVATAIRDDNNIYKMLFYTLVLNADTATKKNNFKLWHERLGHINQEYTKKMIKDGLINGMSQ